MRTFLRDMKAAEEEAQLRRLLGIWMIGNKLTLAVELVTGVERST